MSCWQNMNSIFFFDCCDICLRFVALYAQWWSGGGGIREYVYMRKWGEGGWWDWQLLSYRMPNINHLIHYICTAGMYSLSEMLSATYCIYIHIHTCMYDILKPSRTLNESTLLVDCLKVIHYICQSETKYICTLYSMVGVQIISVNEITQQCYGNLYK